MGGVVKYYESIRAAYVMMFINKLTVNSACNWIAVLYFTYLFLMRLLGSLLW